MTMVAKRVTRLIAGMAEGEREFLTLAALRDTLLPKLISGEPPRPVVGTQPLANPKATAGKLFLAVGEFAYSSEAA